MRKKLKRYLAFLMVLIFNISLLPSDFVYAFDMNNFSITSITIGKTYDRNRIFNNAYITITGKHLKDASVGIITYGEGYIPLGTPKVNSDGILQFEISENQLGEFLSIEGITIPINEANMPNLTDISRNVKIGTDDLVIRGTRLNNVDGTNIVARYGTGNSYTTLGVFSNATEVTISKPSGSLGLQEFIFSSSFKVYDIDFNDNNQKKSVDIQINYTYKDQFRFITDLAIEGDLNMFPNRGEAGDIVYFTADKLDEYDVFFLKDLSGTDLYSNANKGVNTTYKAKSSSDEKDTLTTQVPKLPVGEYYVVLTNKISPGKDPMKEVTGERVLAEKFTIIDGSNKAVIVDVQPNKGPDTGELVTISGQFLGSLNISEFTPSQDSTLTVNQNSSPEELEIDYGQGTYGPSQIKIVSAKRIIRVIIGNKAAFVKDNGEYQVFFNKDLDKIIVRTAQVTDADINPVRDVVIETETVLTKEDGSKIVFKERAVKEKGYTFIVSKIKPEITEAVPNKIQVVNNGGTFQIPSDRYIAIYGKNFMIHKYTNEDGREVIRYPIVQLGPNLIIDKNNPASDFNDPGKSLKGKDEVYLKVFDAYGRELDGSSGNEMGTKILIKLEEGSPAAGVVLGKTFIKVINPMRNSRETGLETQMNDFIEFVNPETSKNPIIQSVNPNVVSVEGGEEVIVTGSNFTDGVKVFIDGKEVTPINRGADGKTITFKAPAGREGQTQLQVMNIEGGMDVYPFSYVKTFTNPKITSIEPRKGNTGTLVVVKGENFLKPDPTGGESAIYRLIGTRILLEGEDINSYNINTATKEIELVAFTPNTPLISVQNSRIQVASYYHSILLRAPGGKLYTLDVDYSGVPVISDGIGNDYKIVYNVQSGKLQADKAGGGLYDLTVSGGNITIQQDSGLSLQIVTPFEVKDGEVIGDLVKVVDKNTIYFTVPILPADGWYDVTVQNPDTKKDTKKDKDGFYYYKQPQSTPVIDEVVPSEGSVAGGNVVTIKGKEFMDNGFEKVRVFINGVEVAPANIQVSTTSDSITVVVPPYSGDLMAEKGVGRLSVPVVVINPDGGSASKENAYTYVIPSSNPRIERILPTSGTAAGGAVVEIFGSDFRTFEPYEDYNRNQIRDENEPYRDLNNNGQHDMTFDPEKDKKELDHPLYSYYYDSPLLPKIYFGMEQALIVEFSATYIKVVTPRGSGTVPVFIENNDSGRSNTVYYSYQGSKPKITKVSPGVGNRMGNTNIGIYGEDFRQSNIKVYKSVSEKETRTMTLVRFGDNTNKNIPRDQANSGLINQGNAQVSLEKDFTAIYKAEYDDTYDSFSEIRVVIKYNDVIYSNTFKRFNDEESFINTNLLVDSDGNRYPFSELIRFAVEDRRFIVERGYAPQVIYISSGELSVTIPPYHTVGVVPVRLINPDGGTAQANFEYRNPDSKPSIIDITNQNISSVSETVTIDGKEVTARIVRVNINGGNTIKVIGRDFRENAVISIGEILDIKPGQVDYSGLPTSLSFEMPAVSEKNIGKYYRLVVLNEDGGTASSDELIPPIYITFIKGESNPQVISMTPDSGPSTGGTNVTIEGKDFRSTMAGFSGTIQVFFGEVPATNVTVSADGRFIYLVTPSHEPGAVEVKIQNPDGTMAKVPKPFTYISNPKITKITDINELTELKTISIEGGQEIKLKGYGFKPGAKVYFNPVLKKAEGESSQKVFYIDGVPYILESGIEATKVEFIDGETVKVVTPEGNKDSSGVILINQDGGASNVYGIKYSLPEVTPPEKVTADLIYDRYIKVTWTPVPGAIEYEIYVVINDSNIEMVGTSKTTSFVYEDLEPRTSYKFVVKALGEFNISQASMESNTVRTGNVAGIPDTDGGLSEKTISSKKGTIAEVFIGRNDYNKALTIDLIRGDLAGAKEIVISIPAEVVTSYYAKDITVIGRDFVLVLNPNAFKTETMLANSNNKSAGVRFRMYPATNNPNLEKGQTALSTGYVLEAYQYVGKSNTAMEHLNSSILLNLDYDGNLSSLRRLNYVSFSRYDYYNKQWRTIKQTHDNIQMAIGDYIDRLGQYMVIGSKR
ncbi:MAG: cell surface receptor IPT/TIG domain-containing protein [Epulopiscium sp.]|nr:cell surface receptor IPT/TIG domain-containing protein [Candidatus Epulonipiscium sp.]